MMDGVSRVRFHKLQTGKQQLTNEAMLLTEVVSSFSRLYKNKWAEQSDKATTAPAAPAAAAAASSSALEIV